MPADPKLSAGARLERAAMRAYLRRQLAQPGALDVSKAALQLVLEWVLLRQKRYGPRPGGLGKGRKAR
jgi:hypothetical protein